MMSNAQSQTSDRFVPTRVLRSNARFYAPANVRQLLEKIVHSPDLALVIDVDALERTTRARIERVMVMGLEALARLGVKILIFARTERERASLLQRVVPGSEVVDAGSYEHVRASSPGAMIGVTDDMALLRTLRETDRGIVLSCDSDVIAPNVTRADDASLRAALWWLVDARSESGASRP